MVGISLGVTVRGGPPVVVLLNGYVFVDGRPLVVAGRPIRIGGA